MIGRNFFLSNTFHRSLVSIVHIKLKKLTPITQTIQLIMEAWNYKLWDLSKPEIKMGKKYFFSKS